MNSVPVRGKEKLFVFLVTFDVKNYEENIQSVAQNCMHGIPKILETYSFPIKEIQITEHTYDYGKSE